jgi:hypothetical protein
MVSQTLLLEYLSGTLLVYVVLLPNWFSTLFSSFSMYYYLSFNMTSAVFYFVFACDEI